MEEPQEATFYQDEGISSHLLPHYLYDKNELQLNLHPVATEPKFNEGLRKNATPAELRSPDFGILKLGSPELEKMIMSLQGSVTTSSTPCSFYNTTSNASISSTNESYARGFTETLQDLHDKQSTGESLIDLADNAADINDPFLGQHTVHNGGTLMNTTPVIRTTTEQLVFANSNTTRNEPTEFFPSTSNLYSNSRGGAMFNPYTQTVGNGYPANVFSYPADNIPYQDQYSHDGNAFRNFTQFGNMLNQQQKQDLQPAFKLEQPQSQIMADPGVLQPIDLEIQEVVKRERKKQRNRVASSKCRKRKLEREARLENRVKDLKERNIELNAVANALKQQVCDLKQKVMDHVGEGCQIMLVHQSQLSTS